MRPHWYKRNKPRLLEAYCFQCAYCGDPVVATTVYMDYVVPRSKGGKLNLFNIVPACPTCDTAKGVEDYKKFLRQRQQDIRTFNHRRKIVARALGGRIVG